jgi:hypothetical protein
VSCENPRWDVGSSILGAVTRFVFVARLLVLHCYDDVIIARRRNFRYFSAVNTETAGSSETLMPTYEAALYRN